MKRFDLDVCEGSASHCDARMSEEIGGDYVLFDDVDAELTALRAQVATMREALEGLKNCRGGPVPYWVANHCVRALNSLEAQQPQQAELNDE